MSLSLASILVDLWTVVSLAGSMRASSISFSASSAVNFSTLRWSPLGGVTVCDQMWIWASMIFMAFLRWGDTISHPSRGAPMVATDKLFAGSIPEIYDRFLVPLIFEPYAVDLAGRR